MSELGMAHYWHPGDLQSWPDEHLRGQDHSLDLGNLTHLMSDSLYSIFKFRLNIWWISKTLKKNYVYFIYDNLSFLFIGYLESGIYIPRWSCTKRGTGSRLNCPAHVDQGRDLALDHIMAWDSISGTRSGSHCWFFSSLAYVQQSMPRPASCLAYSLSWLFEASMIILTHLSGLYIMFTFNSI